MRSRILFAAGVFVVFAALLVFASFSVTAGDATMPGPFGDTQDYDNIALHLLRGRGYGIDYSDPEFRKPYEQHNEEGEYEELLTWTTPYRLSTYRAPLLPFALTATYAVFGRNFLAWRIIEAILVAFALALVCDAAWRAFGSRVALLTAGVMFLSHSYVRYVAIEGLMTEPLAIVMAAIVFWSLMRFFETQSVRYASIAGVAFALLCLDRRFYVPWLPFIAVFIWWISRNLRAVVLFVVFAIALQMPWWIRNIAVTRAFMPLGAPAVSEIQAAYSDLALSHRGIWWRPRRVQAEQSYVHDLGYACTGCDDVKLTEYERRGSRVWIARHISDVPKLVYWKVANTVIFADEAGFIAPLFCFAIVAPLVLWRRRSFIRRDVALMALLFIALDFAVIAVSWSMGWRFMVPVEPMVTILVATAIVSVVFGEEVIRSD